MLSPIGYNVFAGHNLTASMPSAARPMLTGAAPEPHVIPVDVRIRCACEVVGVPATTIPTSTLSAGPHPVGTLLDCYM